uniref:Uncharacterized protein n=1 Tax=Glossina palpalis gambiensis TaxID=67801 RepID=A0A1B0C5M6_9MUSC
MKSMNTYNMLPFLQPDEDFQLLEISCGQFVRYGPMVCWENMTMSPGIIHNEYGNGDSLQSLLQERSRNLN